MGRPSIHGTPMTATERKERSRKNQRQTLYDVLHLSGEHLEVARRILPRMASTKEVERLITQALQGLERALALIKPQ